MCKCSETVKTVLENLISQRNDAFKIYQQYEGAVSAMEQLLPILLPTTDPPPTSIVEAELVKVS